jgi:hypothetical protein
MMMRVERLRRGLGWSQAQRTRRANPNASSINAIGIGRLSPHTRQLQELADAVTWPSDPAALLEEADR